jgi:AcrR family transcriptional regulator
MKRKRLTREESKELTRQRLLDAAQTSFMKKGYFATSVEDLAEAAGYTRGAFYSNFRDKGELLMELLRRDHARMQADLQSIIDDTATREEIEGRALTLYSRLFRDDDCFLLWAEAKLLAARDAKFRVHFNAFSREKREFLTGYICMFSERVGAPLPLPAEVLALGLIGLCDGVQALRLCDPQHVTDDLTEAVLAGFFKKVMFGGQGGQGGPDGA